MNFFKVNLVRFLLAVKLTERLGLWLAHNSKHKTLLKTSQTTKGCFFRFIARIKYTCF